MPNRLTNPPHHHRPAMSLVELVAVLALLASVLGTLTLVNRTLRHEAAEARTRHTLLTLQAALHTYAQAHDAMPPGSAADALALMQADPDTAEQLARVRLVRTDDNDAAHVLDGFGRPLRYHAPDHDRRLPASFVSAGRSGQFGATPTQRDSSRAAADTPSAHALHRRAAADNLYGYELETPNP
ncbi:hypothetical protein ACERK3_14615 [Phycisphaerales bacterium AB-hyl4]|uniref:Type II secretion system protein n=1 Tax=Natronomicrosphaera hydrolytica TaxID=3242702 RepID=A0ABV4U9N3_9BACT